MNFKKKDLEFLKVFQSCMDANSFGGDRLNIIFNKEKSKVYFTLFTNDIKLIKEINSEIKEDFVMSINLAQFNSMSAFCKDDDDIDIAEGKIKFGSNSEYDFETFGFNMETFDYILSMELVGDTIDISDLSKIDKVSFSIGSEKYVYKGQDKNLACIAFQDNHFVAYTGRICSFIKTTNNIKENFYLPKMFYKLYQIFKFKEITLRTISKNYFFMNVNDIKIYLQRFDYDVPYVFSDELKSMYEHENSVVISKDDLKMAVARLKILSQKTHLDRLFFYFDDVVKIEIKDEYRGFENINVKSIDNAIKGSYIICTTSFLYDILNNHKESDIIIKTSNLGDQPLKIEDNVNKVYNLLMVTKKYEDSKGEDTTDEEDNG